MGHILVWFVKKNKKWYNISNKIINMTKNYGYLKYAIENCKEALKELNKINQLLKDSMVFESRTASNHLGMLNRIFQDYLIIKVSSLFDKGPKTISFINVDNNDGEIRSIRQEKIIDELITERHRAVAHSEEEYITDGTIHLLTHEILDSNLNELLIRLELILKNNNESQ